MTKQDLTYGLNACDNLSQALYLLREAVKTAREPIDNGELDFVTTGGELIDMQEYLHDAQRHNSAVRRSFVELIALIQRLQEAYRTAYESHQEALGQIDIAYQQGQTNMLRCMIADLDEADLELLVTAAKTLTFAGLENQQVIREQLKRLLASTEHE